MAGKLFYNWKNSESSNGRSEQNGFILKNMFVRIPDDLFAIR
jgi:hypothetical protein